ncbi:hypothetical protein DdX_18459 [Ditylenchus destructor]|uniref:Uncharacterized protein n=1 Tax=Ditylenchus destructor TaxID=166010 RepID=A0AAD4MJW4_9BILA|nr:hypothetical protein DdX_18459 [Ditylenchus destructor]
MVAYKLPPLHGIPDTPFYQQPHLPATKAQQPNYSSLSPEVMQAFCQAQNSFDLVRAFNNHAGVDQSVFSTTFCNQQSPTSVADFHPPALTNILPAYDPGTLISDMQLLMA